MIVLDTSVLLRFFTGDDKKKALLTEKLLSSRQSLLLLDVVIAELVYALQKLYNTPRSDITKALRFLVARDNVTTTQQACAAIILYEQRSLSIVDCFVISYGQEGEIASFDKKLLKTPSISKYWK